MYRYIHLRNEIDQYPITPYHHACITVSLYRSIYISFRILFVFWGALTINLYYKNVFA